MWSSSRKKFLDIPISIADEINKIIFETIDKRIENIILNIQIQINRRNDPGLKKDDDTHFEHKQLWIFDVIPDSLINLFHLQKEKCSCHDRHLSLRKICEHNALDYQKVLHDSL